MFQKQEGKCGICARAFGGKKDCAIDQCHVTGKVRELLCDNCNTMLGLSQENEQTLLKAIEYLRKYKN